MVTIVSLSSFCAMYIFKHVSPHTDATPSFIAHFNDSRCTAGGVCATDALFFTCELNEVALLRVVLPSGDQEHISLGDTAADVNLPAGVTAVFLSIIETNATTRNISLTLYISNASILDCGEIECDDTTDRSVVMAGCPVHGKSDLKKK